MLPVSRDDPAYRWGDTPDHNWKGLYMYGPEGEDCAIARIIEISKIRLRVTASSPDAERRRRVVYRGRSVLDAARRWRRDGYDENDPRAEQFGSVLRAVEGPNAAPRMMRIGDHLKPAGKRPNSGRKRRAVA